MHYIKVKHSGNLGDIIYSLSVVQQLAKDKDAKIVYYIYLDQPSTYTDKTHPVGSVMMNRKMFDMAKPLLLQQPYIHGVIEVEKGENIIVDYDLDLFRKDHKNLSAADIKTWITVTYPELRADLSAQCLFTTKVENDYIIINRSQRYNAPLIDYTILEDKGKCVFVGVESEFKVMKAIMPSIEHLQIADFKDLAGFILGCKLFVGNQSMPFAIAEQLKVKRVLEQYFGCPNVLPQGGEHYTFYTQKQFENIINKYIFA
jgi:hypothetical protein